MNRGNSNKELIQTCHCQLTVSGVQRRSKKTKAFCDMYPLYWTPSRGGIIMRYTYEYKRKCVELYREGKWPETPEGVK